MFIPNEVLIVGQVATVFQFTSAGSLQIIQYPQNRSCSQIVRCISYFCTYEKTSLKEALSDASASFYKGKVH